jgi:hypothetical protein
MDNLLLYPPDRKIVVYMHALKMMTRPTKPHMQNSAVVVDQRLILRGNSAEVPFPSRSLELGMSAVYWDALVGRTE